jgi:hypothetical protein
MRNLGSMLAVIIEALISPDHVIFYLKDEEN